MILTNSSQFISQLVTDLEAIEETLSNPYFSYTLGFNIKRDEICQCKLYIRFFDRDDSFLKFFEIFTDSNIKQMATHDFHHAEDIAFKKSALGFKGFTIGVVKDFKTNRTGYGWGARATSIISGPYFYGYRFLDDFLSRRMYKYIAPNRGFLKLPFMTEMVEIQESINEKEHKYCLCPTITRDNLSEISRSLEENLSPSCRLYHNEIIGLNPALTLVNMGGGRNEEKLYYHNFKKSNKIKHYSLKEDGISKT
tara:strand:- start:1105 stop:1860 length:756 start_codon:yes stop_codon:yes gene_type:complete